MTDTKTKFVYAGLVLTILLNVIMFARVSKLENQIAGVKFLQGPVGPPGLVGPAGRTGPAGMPGMNGRDGDSASSILPVGCPRLSTVQSNLPDAFGNGWPHQVVVCW